MSAPIEVLAIRVTDGKTTVKAYVDCQIGGVTILGAKIIQQEGQTAWLGMPGVKSDRGWNDVIRLSKPLRQRLTEAVLDAWTAKQAGENGTTQTHRAERPNDPREAHVDELAQRFDERDPDEIPFVLAWALLVPCALALLGGGSVA